MVTDEQRAYMYHQVRKFRQTKPLFTMDFWNDAEYAKAALPVDGGTSTLMQMEILSRAHLYTTRTPIYNRSIIEALKSPLFMEFHQHPAI